MQWWCSAQGIPWTWSWRAYPGVWIFVALLAFAWWRVARRDPSGISRWRALAGLFGVASTWAALDWPIGTLGAGYLTSAHALQFLLLAMLAPPLLLLGISDQALAAALQRHPRALRAIAALTQPLVGMIGFTAVIVATHVPAVVDTLMVRQLGALALDLAWLLSGLLFWWPVVRNVPARPGFGPPAHIGYIALGTIAHTGVSIVFLMAKFPLFSIYELAPPFTWLTPLDDQQLAGGFMLLLGNAIVVTAMAIVFFRWMGTGEADAPAGSNPAPAPAAAAGAATTVAPDTGAALS